jgi:CubicO group peptidase (beta-lactamase class C family)
MMSFPLHSNLRRDPIFSQPFWSICVRACSNRWPSKVQSGRPTHGGINLGGSGLHTTTEDIARFGQMYLQKGMWNGARIVTEEWIAEATKPHPDNSNTPDQRMADEAA